MVALGLVLLVLAVLLAIGIAAPNGEEVSAEAFGVALDGVSVGGLFLVGVVTGAVAVLALGMVLGGLARRRGKAVARKRQVTTIRSDAEGLAEENARLKEQLDEQQSRTARSGPASGLTSGDATRHDAGRADDVRYDDSRHDVTPHDAGRREGSTG